MSAGQGASTGQMRRLRSHRASTYFLLAVLLVSAGVGGYLWRQRTVTREVYVAAADLPAYHQITTADVRRAHVRSVELPRDTTAELGAVVGRYTMAREERGRPIDRDRLGPRLPANALAGQVIVGFSASIADIGGGALERADRVRVVLSSTSSDQPRSGVIEATVLDTKPEGEESGRFVVVCAFAAGDEATLLAAGGTARIFFLRVGPAAPP